MRLRRWAVLGVLAVATGTGPIAAAESEDAARRLREIERSIDQGQRGQEEIRRRAGEIGAELDRLRHEAVGIARAIQDRETAVLDLEGALAALAREEEDKLAKLESTRDRSVQVVMALQRLALNPPEAMLIQRTSPTDTVRGAILLRAALPTIEEQARHLRDELRSLAETRLRVEATRRSLVDATAALERERVRLAALTRNRERMHRQLSSEGEQADRRIAALAREAADIKDLLDRLEGARLNRRPPTPDPQKDGSGGRAPSAARSFGAARGALQTPAIGRLTGLYGQALDTGMTRKGVTIETRPGATVVAPYDGVVAFAGPFRGYGQLLIIDHGEGYHTLLAGLERIDPSEGRAVVGGEPIGIMGSASGESPALYLELRRGGQPINPLPWLAVNRGKVSG